MPSSSRIVFAEDLVGAAPWRPGPLEGGRGTALERRATARQGEAAEPTYEDGLRDGFARGVEQARLESEMADRARIAALAQRCDELVGAVTGQLALLQQAAAEDVTALAVEIARSAFGAALRVRDDAIAPAVVAVLGALVDEHARPTLRLHPDDASLVGEQLAPLLASRDVQMVPDATILPGGCRIDTARGSVDGTVQTRWRRALAALGRDDAWVEA